MILQASGRPQINATCCGEETGADLITPLFMDVDLRSLQPNAILLLISMGQAQIYVKMLSDSHNHNNEITVTCRNMSPLGTLLQSTHLQKTTNSR